MLSDQSGNEVSGSRVAYLPYGSVRLGEASTLPTDYTFTGQRNEAGIGLMHYGARFYSPRLGRFVSADTIVPEPGNPQALNRYSYARNSPCRYTDPSGHYIFEEDPRKPYFLIPSLPPQPSGTTWDTPLIFWIEPGGLYGEGLVYWKVEGRTVGPFSVYVPPAAPCNWPDYGSQEGWRQRGGDYIGLFDVTKRGLGNKVANALANYAAGMSAEDSDPPVIVPETINVAPKFLGQDQPIDVPGKYAVGGLGEGTAPVAVANALAMIASAENRSLRYVSITVWRKGDLCRALVVSHDPKWTHASYYISYREETSWYRETRVIRDPNIPIITQDWRHTTLGRR